MAIVKEKLAVLNTTYQVSSRGEIILSHCLYSSSVWFRTKGLLGRKNLGEGEGLWLKPCNGIHTFFMKFPIDAVFLDKENKIVKIFHAFRPWRITPIFWKACSTLEMSEGLAEKYHLNIGDELKFTEN